jgi:hypothetical protein
MGRNHFSRFSVRRSRRAAFLPVKEHFTKESNMNQIKNSRLLPALALTAMLALLMTMVAMPQQAEACGNYSPPTDEELVQRTIERHLYAVRQGDAKAVNANWSLEFGQSTALVKTGGVDKIQSEKIGNASRRWSKNKDSKMTWKIQQMDVDQKAAFVKLAINWHGQKRVEYLTLLKVNHAWKLVSKVHVAAEPSKVKAKTVSLY